MPRVRPAIRPRASASHCGEPRPGQRRHEVHALRSSSTSRARLSLSAALRSAPSPSRATGSLRRRRGRSPSTANWAAAPGGHRSGLSNPPAAGPASAADVSEHERPGAVRRLRLAGGEAPLTEECSLLVSGHARQRHGRAEQAHLGHDGGRGDDGGSTARSTEKRSRSSSSHSRRTRSSNMVREAFVTSVMWAQPPVSFHASHESIVPKASSSAPSRSARGSIRACSRRSTGHRGARFARARGRPAAARNALPSAGPATRSPAAPDVRSGVPRRPSSRAGSRCATAARSRAPIPASASAASAVRSTLTRSRSGRAPPSPARGSTARSRSTRDRPAVGSRRRRGRWCRSFPGRLRGARGLPDEPFDQRDVDPIDQLVSPPEAIGGQCAAHCDDNEARRPWPRRRRPRCPRMPTAPPARSGALWTAGVPLGMWLPLRTSSAVTITLSWSARPAAATTGSISARNAPETTATGTRSAAYRTASRTGSGHRRAARRGAST